MLGKQSPAPRPTGSRLCGSSGLIPATTVHTPECVLHPVALDLPAVCYLPGRPHHMSSAHPVCCIRCWIPGWPAEPGSEELGRMNEQHYMW